MAPQKSFGLVCGADARKALGGHRVQGLVFGNVQRVLITNQSLGVELEGFTHEFGDSSNQLVQFAKRRRRSLPPNNDTVKYVTPDARNSGAQLAKGINCVVVKEIANLAVDSNFRFSRWFLVMFQAIEPQAENNHQIKTTEGMLDTPVGGGRLGNPVDALNGSNLNAFEALLNNLVHFRRSLHLVAGNGHGCGHLVRRVVAEGFLDGFEVNFQASPRVAVDGH